MTSPFGFDYSTPAQLLAGLDANDRDHTLLDADLRTDEQLAAHLRALVEDVLLAAWDGDNAALQAASAAFTEAYQYPSTSRLIVDVENVVEGDFIKVQGYAQGGGTTNVVGLVERALYAQYGDELGFELTVRQATPPGRPQPPAVVVWLPDEDTSTVLRLSTNTTTQAKQ